MLIYMLACLNIQSVALYMQPSYYMKVMRIDYFYPLIANFSCFVNFLLVWSI